LDRSREKESTFKKKKRKEKSQNTSYNKSLKPIPRDKVPLVLLSHLLRGLRGHRLTIRLKFNNKIIEYFSSLVAYHHTNKAPVY
jgi:hypothetical protein